MWQKASTYQRQLHQQGLRIKYTSMTTDDLTHLKKTIGISPLALMRDPVWQTAFAEYNKSNEKQLSLMCVPCYSKVLNYHLNKKHEVIA